jgi:hypothetical protein
MKIEPGIYRLNVYYAHHHSGMKFGLYISRWMGKDIYVVRGYGRLIDITYIFNFYFPL